MTSHELAKAMLEHDDMLLEVSVDAGTNQDVFGAVTNYQVGALKFYILCKEKLNFDPGVKSK